MDSGEFFAVDPDDLPLLGAAGLIAVGAILVLADVGGGNPMVAIPLVVGTIAFVTFAIERVSAPGVRVFVAGSSMVAGSALVGVDPAVAFDFGGPIGAALFLFGAIGLAQDLDD